MRDGLSRRVFFGSLAAGGGALLLGCGGRDTGSQSSAGDVTSAPVPGASGTSMVTTPRGRVTVPLQPERVIAIDSRQDLEIAIALELPVVGYTSHVIRPWVPLPATAEPLRSPVDLVELVRAEPDLVICTDIESPYWFLPGLDSVAPVLPVDPRAEWDSNLRTLAGWLGREAAADTVLGRYRERVERVRRRHADALTDPIAVVGLDTDDTLTDLGHSPSVVAQAARDTGANMLHFGVDLQSPLDVSTAAPALGATQRLIVASDDPDVDADYLREHPALGTLPAIAENRFAVTADLSYGSVYTALESISLLDEVLRR